MHAIVVSDWKNIDRMANHPSQPTIKRDTILFFWREQSAYASHDPLHMTHFKHCWSKFIRWQRKYLISTGRFPTWQTRPNEPTGTSWSFDFIFPDDILFFVISRGVKTKTWNSCLPYLKPANQHYYFTCFCLCRYWQSQQVKSKLFQVRSRSVTLKPNVMQPRSGPSSISAIL